jgi:head-tail adaptor
MSVRRANSQVTIQLRNRTRVYNGTDVTWTNQTTEWAAVVELSDAEKMKLGREINDPLYYVELRNDPNVSVTFRDQQFIWVDGGGNILQILQGPFTGASQEFRRFLCEDISGRLSP